MSLLKTGEEGCFLECTGERNRGRLSLLLKRGGGGVTACLRGRREENPFHSGKMGSPSLSKKNSRLSQERGRRFV